MSLDELGHYHSLMGMNDDCEVDVVYKGLLLYQDEYYIAQRQDGSFELILGNMCYDAESYTSADFTDLQHHLYDYYLSEAGQ